MSNGQSDPLLQMETTCGSLLYELQIIWDEVGESDAERDRMLLELERECLEVYRRKVDQANRCRAQIRQAIADSEAELAAICSAMGERPVHIRQSDQNLGNLKEELRAILPQIEEMRKRKCDRKNQFVEVLEQIQKLKHELSNSSGYISTTLVVDEADLSLRKLEELQREMLALQNEKSERLKQVLDHLNSLNSLCLVLGMDFKQTVSEVHPSLGDPEGSKNISHDTIQQLAAAIQKLREIKIQRMQRLQDLAMSLLQLWNLMDTPLEEQQVFQKVTCNVAASENEIVEPNMLSIDIITFVEKEVSRLEELKTSKMKELVLKKKSELEDICRKTHLIPETDSSLDIAIEAIESGAVDATYVLEKIEVEIAKVKEEAFSRKDILDKVEKWMVACEEESWLEEYNRDENRYNAGRGAHLTLKRAEKARVLVNKLPTIVDALASKTSSWENERGIEFTYDGVRLLSMLEEYNILRQEKEQERKRQRDQKKLQGQLLAEQEALYGSKPSPMKNQSTKKGPRLSCGGASNRRLSLGGTILQTPKHDMLHSTKATPNTRHAKKNDRLSHDNPTRDDRFQAMSSGRRGLDIAGLPLKPHSLNPTNAHEIELPIMRKPFSPISSTDSSKSKATNILEDLNTKHNEMLQKTLTSNNTSPFTTPSKTISTMDEENRTPKTMAIPMPSTPSTVSVPMLTAITPAPCVPKSMEDEDIEYSFEERRAGFVLPKDHRKSLVQI
ncbi:65-kDa microtubule-associated protein 3-like [Olea europaea var. sylvestris]|uniref:65-kDa microtubule-associated 3-like n=1 Tax=Olea europaea subsp. europaea TaxID=158383 RepID=A0A8S0SAY8_OLEEU|nr:65-kDa microtubule-associated protein 3-like [Olea europaea var. sylvestris]XP_022873647.1 65-kDa microtubule-associated protein 3-like [Olea europaea var. sylvestris]CAA2988902.1 65-kDa microtubule-associated 3-like [Olea europaea subsp. europaea]